MKANAVSVVLFHFHPGHHKDVNAWHDSDHRPEVLATIPHIYHSQRWVAPADYVAARPPTDLPHGGGEYAVLYWSDGTPEQLQSEFDSLGVRLNLLDRMQPMRYIDGVWRSRTRPLVASARAGAVPSTDAVPFAPNTGLVVTIVELSEPSRQEWYGRWLDTVHVPAVLGSGLFTGCFTMLPVVGGGPNSLVHLYYTDRDDPLQAFTELLRIESRPTNGGFAGMEEVRQRTFSGVYRPIVPGQYDFYD